MSTDKHFFAPTYDLGYDDFKISPALVQGAYEITALHEGKRVLVASVPYDEEDPTGKVANVMFKLLRQHRAAQDFKAGRTNSVESSPANPIDVAADVHSDYAEWVRIAQAADAVAEQWQAFADQAAELHVPVLSLLPKLPTSPSTRYNADGPTVAPRFTATDSRHDDQDRVVALVANAVTNAAAYRRYAEQVRAYIATEWDYLAHPEAFPINEQEIML
jgi:hypothetical protein